MTDAETIRDLQEKLDLQRTTCRGLASMYETKRAENVRLHQLMDAQDIRLTELRTEVKELKQEVDNLDKERRRLWSQAVEKDDMLLNLRIENAKLTMEIRGLKGEN